MNAKEYLKQPYYKEYEIKKLIKELNSYRVLVGGISSPILDEKTESMKNIEPIFVKYIAEISEIEYKVQAECSKLVNLKCKLSMQIDKVSDLNQRLVLRYRHIMCYTWSQIAAEMNYSVRWVHKIYSRAIKSFEVIHNELF